MLKNLTRPPPSCFPEPKLPERPVRAFGQNGLQTGGPVLVAVHSREFLNVLPRRLEVGVLKLGGSESWWHAEGTGTVRLWNPDAQRNAS